MYLNIYISQGMIKWIQSQSCTCESNLQSGSLTWDEYLPSFEKASSYDPYNIEMMFLP